MCGRIALYTEPDRLARIFDAVLGPDVDPAGHPSWNVPPTRSVLAVADVPGTADVDAQPRAAETPAPDVGSPDGAKNHRELGRYRWGLVPSWATDPSVGSRMFNARAETVASKPSFRAAFTARRLAVVADGFYEWQQGPGKTRNPYYFTRADGRPLALAGLWEQWKGDHDADPDSGRGAVPLRTCTVITTAAGADMEGVHHRMPVVLESDVLEEWLDPRNRDKPELETLLVPSPAGTLVRRPVRREVGNVRNDGPELIDEVVGR